MQGSCHAPRDEQTLQCSEAAMAEILQQLAISRKHNPNSRMGLSDKIADGVIFRHAGEMGGD